MTIVFTVVFVALVFEFINGFHDTANSIATVVSTKVLTPRQAICMAATTNLLGALSGTAVAKTIASGLVDTRVMTSEVLVCVLTGAIIWNLITWRAGLPSSSSHALVGGLCGSCIAASNNDLSVVVWSVPSNRFWWEGKGIVWKVIVPMITSPICGLVIGALVMAVLYWLLRSWRPLSVARVFGRAQLLSSASMGFMHGTNDARKTMGIIALSLLAATQAGTLDGVPPWLSWLKALQRLRTDNRSKSQPGSK